MRTIENLHIGRMILGEAAKLKLSGHKLSKILGMSSANVYDIFHRPQTDVIILARMSKALKHNFFDDIAVALGIKKEDKIRAEVTASVIDSDVADLLSKAGIKYTAEEKVHKMRSRSGEESIIKELKYYVELSTMRELMEFIDKTRCGVVIGILGENEILLEIYNGYRE